MSEPDADSSAYNFAGALIFTAYVISALFLTAFITYNLTTNYLTLDTSRLSQQQGRSTLKGHIQVFFILSVLSFSVLSYHMLSFLIVSYKTWASQQGIAIPVSILGPNGLLGHERTTIHVWRWLTHSTLFLDFAQEICATTPRYWWTGQALWKTIGTNIHISYHGYKYRTPHLWAYIALAQILPISFIHNLFYLSLLIQAPESSQLIKSSPFTTILYPPLLPIYSTCVILAPLTTNAIPIFTLVIFALRAGLLVPALFPQYVDTFAAQDVATRGFPSQFAWALLIIVPLLRGWKALGSILGAVNEGSAISALGWDYMLGWASDFAFAWGVEGDVLDRARKIARD